MNKIQKILDTNNNSIIKFGNRPKNLTKELLPVIKDNYSASIKADGLRCFLFYDSKNINSIVNPFTISKIDKTKLKDIYLLDCEFIEELNEYYVFDILICKGKDVRNLNLKDRIDLIDKSLLTDNILLKDIYNLENNENIFKISEKIYKKKYKYEIDGIVYTPLYESYLNNFIYKWKPLEQQTIDFLIREVNSNKDKKTYGLFVSSNNKFIKEKLLRDNNFTKLFPFITKNNNYYPSPFGKTTLTVKTFVNKGIEYGNYNNIVLKDNTIVEFCFKNQWIPVRIRMDKTEGYLQNFKDNTYEVTKGPNSWRTAMSIQNYINNPIDKNILFGKKDFVDDYYVNVKRRGLKIPLYKYNNYIKKSLYEKYLKKDYNVLDLAGGRGGDLYKIKESKYVLHINKVNKLLEEAKNRFNRMNNKPEMNFLQFDLLGNNLNKINKLKKVKEFDLITCQFAFHYLCKDKKSIDFIVKIIDGNLKKGGIFMLTGYDGKLIFDLLKDSKNKDFRYNNKLFARIVKKYGEKKFKNYGQKINVTIEKIGVPQDEFLINFDYLKKKLKNFKIKEENNFGENIKSFNKKLSEEEINYIKLHKYIVFVKE